MSGRSRNLDEWRRQGDYYEDKPDLLLVAPSVEEATLCMLYGPDSGQVPKKLNCKACCFYETECPGKEFLLKRKTKVGK